MPDAGRSDAAQIQRWAWPGAERAALAAVLAAAAAIRLWNIFAHTYVIFPDETFQYLEEGHRLAFGSGVVTWEYIEGIRSWLLPGILAAIMRATDAIDGRPLAYVDLIRILCGALSLVVPLLAFTLVRKRHGLAAAFAAGIIGAFWYDLVYFSPVILTEVLATHCALLAYLINGPASPPASRRAFAAGLLYGVAASLRFQYAPAIALLAAVQAGRDRRVLRQTLLGAALMIVVVLGGLDWVTWGAPFQSVWLNYRRNAVDGIAAAMGTEHWSYPFAFFLADWGPLAPVLAGLAVLGASRAGGLALAAALTLVLHALSPHKEVRFLYFAIAVAPILIGLGLAEALRRLKLGALTIVGAAPTAAALLVGAEAMTAVAGTSSPDTWNRDSAVLEAFVHAGQAPDLCGVAVRALHIPRTGGYTYLHRSVPLYFEIATMTVSTLPAPLPLRVELDRSPVTQFPGVDLAQHTDLFNVMIAPPGEGWPNFERRVCFGGSPSNPQLCLFERPGTCQRIPSSGVVTTRN